MRNSLLECLIMLPQKEEQEKSHFKPINAAATKLEDFLEKNLPEKTRNTAAYHAFGRSKIEFINNARDAGATRVSVRVLENEDSTEIQILDNGRGLSPEKETLHYDWKKAFLAVSDKKIDGDMLKKNSCGQHIALCRATYTLERESGQLGLKNRKNVRGALVTLVSPCKPCNSETFFEAKSGKGKTILDEMFNIIYEQDPNAINAIKMIAASPDFTGSRKDAAKRVIITTGETPVDASAAAVSTSAPPPTPLLMISPLFRRNPSSSASLSASTISFFSPTTSNTNRNEFSKTSSTELVLTATSSAQC